MVALINNFTPRSLVDYYTVTRGQETEPKLPPSLAAPTHHLLMQVRGMLSTMMIGDDLSE